jgi:hypothetical protein
MITREEANLVSILNTEKRILRELEEEHEAERKILARKKANEAFKRLIEEYIGENIAARAAEGECGIIVGVCDFQYGKNYSYYHYPDIWMNSREWMDEKLFSLYRQYDAPMIGSCVYTYTPNLTKLVCEVLEENGYTIHVHHETGSSVYNGSDAIHVSW